MPRSWPSEFERERERRRKIKKERAFGLEYTSLCNKRFPVLMKKSRITDIREIWMQTAAYLLQFVLPKYESRTFFLIPRKAPKF